MEQIIGKYNSAIVFIDNIDDVTRTQIYDMCNNPAYKGNDTIRIMPDCHAGKGSVIGFTMKFNDRLDPRCVGVDIGCGCKAVKLDAKSGDIDMEQLDKAIQRNIPMGANINEQLYESDRMFYKTYLSVDDKYVEELCRKIDMPLSRFWYSVGSLGSGNHFQELSIDKDDNIWLTVHTGSRNLGVKVCTYHTDIMLNKFIDKKKYDEELHKGVIEIRKNYTGVEIQNQINILSNNIKQLYLNKVEYLSGENLNNYLTDMKLCQKYASLNRFMIINRIVALTGFDVIDEIESVHNYVDIDNKIIRKGAISSIKNERVIIPLNMRDGSIIAKGQSNPDWNYSAPHGAGRIMSRSKAKQEVDMELYKLSMEGIYSTCINESTLDESPFAYKDKDLIIKAISDTVEIEDIIKPILNIKASE